MKRESKAIWKMQPQKQAKWGDENVQNRWGKETNLTVSKKTSISVSNNFTGRIITFFHRLLVHFIGCYRQINELFLCDKGSNYNYFGLQS